MLGTIPETPPHHAPPRGPLPRPTGKAQVKIGNPLPAAGRWHRHTASWKRLPGSSAHGVEYLRRARRRPWRVRTPSMLRPSMAEGRKRATRYRKGTPPGLEAGRRAKHSIEPSDPLAPFADSGSRAGVEQAPRSARAATLTAALEPAGQRRPAPFRGQRHLSQRSQAGRGAAPCLSGASERVRVALPSPMPVEAARSGYTARRGTAPYPFGR